MPTASSTNLAIEHASSVAAGGRTGIDCILFSKLDMDSVVEVLSPREAEVLLNLGNEIALDLHIRAQKLVHEAPRMKILNPYHWAPKFLT